MSRRRTLGLLLVAVSLLVFVNARDAESDSANIFRTADYISSDIEPLVTQRHADQLTHLELEAASVVAAGFAAVFAFVPIWTVPGSLNPSEGASDAKRAMRRDSPSGRRDRQ